MGPRILFTHSTFTADVMNKIRPMITFNVLETAYNVAIRLKDQFLEVAPWSAGKHVPEAGFFDVRGGNVVHAFDPSLTLDAA